MGFIIHFYIIFGTNLLTRGPVQIAVVVFFAYFSVLQKRNIKRSPNGMKPSGVIFFEQTQSWKLGVDVKKQTRKPRGRRARPRGVGAPPCLVASSFVSWRRVQVSWIIIFLKITFPKVSFCLDSVWYSFSAKLWNRQKTTILGWASG